jgi:hypothetical protein
MRGASDRAGLIRGPNPLPHALATLRPRALGGLGRAGLVFAARALGAEHVTLSDNPPARFDPMYDSYVSMARRGGGVVVPVRLRLPDFSVPLDELAAAITPRTKLLMVNTPHNPSGKASTRAMGFTGWAGGRDVRQSGVGGLDCGSGADAACQAMLAREEEHCSPR